MIDFSVSLNLPEEHRVAFFPSEQPHVMGWRANGLWHSHPCCAWSEERQYPHARKKPFDIFNVTDLGNFRARIVSPYGLAREREAFKSVTACELNQIIACLPSYSSLTSYLPHTRKHYVVESIHPYLERSHQLHFPKGALQLQNDYSRLEAERITISVSCVVGKHTCGPICNKNPYS